MISQVYPHEIRREVEEFLSEGPLIVAANPGAGIAELVTEIASDTVVLRVREAATPLGFRMQLARLLVARAETMPWGNDAAASSRPPARTILALQFGRRARDIVAFAQGDVERDIAFADLVSGLTERTAVVIDEAHLVDTIAGSEVLWGLRDHRQLVLATRPWFVERLRHPGAAFFGHGRTVDLSSATLQPLLEDPRDVRFVVERTLGNADLAAEILSREGDVRRGWSEAVEARRSVTLSLIHI